MVIPRCALAYVPLSPEKDGPADGSRDFREISVVGAASVLTDEVHMLAMLSEVAKLLQYCWREDIIPTNTQCCLIIVANIESARASIADFHHRQKHVFELTTAAASGHRTCALQKVDMLAFWLLVLLGVGGVRSFRGLVVAGSRASWKGLKLHVGF